MDLSQVNRDIAEIGRSAPDGPSGWRQLIEYLFSKRGAQYRKMLQAVDVAADIGHVRRQLEALVGAEPPSPGVDAYYFGLFDTGAHQESVGYYVAGVVGYDPADDDSLCDPAWWPRGRYLTCAALGAVKKAGVAAARRGHDAIRESLSYAGELGAALLVTRFAARGVLAGHTVVVGFDAGDCIDFTAEKDPTASRRAPPRTRRNTKSAKG